MSDTPLAQVRDVDDRPVEMQDGMAVPHILMFQSLYQSGWHTYLLEQWDNAVRQNRENALRMLNDEHLMACLWERMRGVTRLGWSLETDNPNDPREKFVAEGVTKCVRATPRLRELLRAKMWALWYGRAGAQVKWLWRPIAVADPRTGQAVAKRGLCVAKHLPVNGDKIGYRHDHVPFVSVYSAKDEDLPGASLIYSTRSKAVELVGGWRERFLLHNFSCMDADFTHGDRADAVHGVGLRSWLAFSWWLKFEFLGNVIRALDRTGLGFVVIEYDESNDKAKQEAVAAAKNMQTDRTILVVPRAKNSAADGSVRVVDAPVAGVQVTLLMQEACERREERMIVGQAASSRSETSGLGTHDTDLQADTKQQILEEDADSLAESLTGSEEEPGLVSIIQKWTFPWADFPVRWKFALKPPNTAELLEAAGKVFEMGIPVKVDELRRLAGLSKPSPTDEVVSLQQQQEQAHEQERQMAELINNHALEQQAAAAGQEGEGEEDAPFEPQQGEELPFDDDDRELLERVRKAREKRGEKEDYGREQDALHYAVDLHPSAQAGGTAQPARPAHAAVAQALATGRPFTAAHLAASSAHPRHALDPHLSAAVNAGHATTQFDPNTNSTTFHPHPSLPMLAQFAARGPLEMHEAANASGIDISRNYSDAYGRLLERGLVERGPNNERGMGTWQASEAGRRLLAGEVQAPAPPTSLGVRYDPAQSQERHSATARQAGAQRPGVWQRMFGTPTANKVQGKFSGTVQKPENMLQHIADVGLSHLKDDELASLSGATEGNARFIRHQGGGVHIEVNRSGDPVHMQRTVYRKFGANAAPEGDLVMHNDLFRVQQGGQGKGLEVFSNQVTNLLEHGFDRIETLAAGDYHRSQGPEASRWNGYATWAKFGYDGPVPGATRLRLPEQFQGAKTVQELRAMPGGEEAWMEHGSTFDATFDLKPGSKSLEILNQYRAKKGLPPVEHPKAKAAAKG